MTEAERNKYIVRLMNEGFSDDQIKAELRKKDSVWGKLKDTMARQKQAEDVIFKPTPSQGMGAVGKVAQRGAESVLGALDRGAQAAEKRTASSPLESIMNGTFSQDMKGGLYNVGKGLMDVMDRVFQPATALDSGVAEAYREPSLMKKPVAFGKGVVQNITKPSSEQLTMSQVTGKEGLQGLVQDLLVPSTFLGGGGAVKALKSGATKANALRAGAKNIGKATLMGGAAANAYANSDNPESALPLAVAATLQPKQWNKIPDGFYSALERETQKLASRKPQRSLEIGRKLKANPLVKPDEWNDVGMDEILASKDMWDIESLIAEIQARRPEISFEDSDKWKAYSTARNSLEYPSPYKSVEVKQKGVKSPNLHYGDDTIAHLRYDVNKPEFRMTNEMVELDRQVNVLAKELGEARRFGETDKAHALDEQLDLLETKYAEAYDNAPNPTKDMVINEGQSDLHQAAAKKVANHRINPVEDGLITTERLRELTVPVKVGYRSPEDTAKVNAIQRMLDKSLFNWQNNRPSRGKAIKDYADSLNRKQSVYENRKFEDLQIQLPRSKPNFTKRFYHPTDPKRHQIPWEHDPSKSVAQTKNQNYDNLEIGANRMGPTEDQAWENLLNNQYRYDPNDPHAEALLEKAERTPSERLRSRIEPLMSKPDGAAAFKKTWPSLLMKKALKDGVDMGADRIGVLDSLGVNDILRDENPKPGRNRWADETLPQLIQNFLKSQGIKSQFGPLEGFRDGKFQARFIELTPQIKEMVRNGMPLYAAIAAVGLGGMALTPEQEAQITGGM